MIDVNTAKHGVANPQRRRTEKRPFESWAELEAVATHLGPHAGPMVIFAAATGLRSGEWIALERRDADLDERVVYVRRAYRNGRIKHPKTEGSMRSVPLQDVALAALERVPVHEHTPLLFPAANGGYFDLHNFRNREWKPAQQAAGITPSRRVYDLRHTFATFALRAGISTFALSRYMGASLTMIDRHYGPSQATAPTTPAVCSTSTAPPRNGRGRWWTLGGRRKGQKSSATTTETRCLFWLRRSPQRQRRSGP